MQLKLNERARKRLDLAGLEFLAGFLGVEARRRPGNLEALVELGHVLTRLGRHEEGLEVDRRLVSLVPENSTVHYNLACSLALLERPDEALDALQRAVDLGYADPDHLEGDSDLTSLRDSGRFQEILRRLRAAEGRV